MDNISSPSLASTVLIRLLLESLKWTLMLDYQFDSENWGRELSGPDRLIIVYDEAREVKFEYFKPRTDETGRVIGRWSHKRAVKEQKKNLMKRR